MSGIHVQNGKILVTPTEELRGCCCAGPEPCVADACGSFDFEIASFSYVECSDHATHRNASLGGSMSGLVGKVGAAPGSCYDNVALSSSTATWGWGEGQDPTDYAPVGDFRSYWDADTACQRSLSLSRRDALYVSVGRHNGTLLRWHACTTGALKPPASPGVQPSDTGRLVGIVNVGGGRPCTAAVQPIYGVTWNARCSAGRGMTIRTGGLSYTVTAATPISGQSLSFQAAYGANPTAVFYLYLR